MALVSCKDIPERPSDPRWSAESNVHTEVKMNYKNRFF